MALSEVKFPRRTWLVTLDSHEWYGPFTCKEHAVEYGKTVLKAHTFQTDFTRPEKGTLVHYPETPHSDLHWKAMEDRTKQFGEGLISAREYLGHIVNSLGEVYMTKSKVDEGYDTEGHVKMANSVATMIDDLSGEELLKCGS